MATLSSLQDTIQGIGSRLQAENDSRARDLIMTNNLNLDFTRERPGSERRPRNSSLVEAVSTGRPNTISARTREQRPRIQPLLFIPPPKPQDSPELKAHMSKIALKNGILTIDGQKYNSNSADLKYLAELGSGTSGNVVKMLHQPSDKIIAVKQMNRSGNPEETKRVFFDLEVVLKSHDCPFIVQCLGCFVSDTHVWICMELMATCLDKLLKRCKKPIPENILGKISVATVKALHYLKENHGVIHRDVKPSNILLDERGNIKLCDFGISGRLVDSKAHTRSAGCAAYMAPERIEPPDPHNPDYDIRADVWSLGITLVELATGQFPYRDCKNDFEVLTKVLGNEPPSLPKEQNFSQNFRDFVNACLVKDYRQRPKYRRLLDYPFIKRYEKEEVDVASWFEVVWAASAPTEHSSSSGASANSRVRSSPHRSNRICPRLPQQGSSSSPHRLLAAGEMLTEPPAVPRLVPRRSVTPDAVGLKELAAVSGSAPSAAAPSTPVRSSLSGTNASSADAATTSGYSSFPPENAHHHQVVLTSQSHGSTETSNQQTSPHYLSQSSQSSFLSSYRHLAKSPQQPFPSPSLAQQHNHHHHHHHHHHHSQHPVMGARALSASPLPRTSPQPLSPPRSAPASTSIGSSRSQSNPPSCSSSSVTSPLATHSSSHFTTQANSYNYSKSPQLHSPVPPLVTCVGRCQTNSPVYQTTSPPQYNTCHTSFHNPVFSSQFRSGPSSSYSPYSGSSYQNPYMSSSRVSSGASSSGGTSIKQYKGSKTSPVGIITSYSNKVADTHYGVDSISGNSFTSSLVLDQPYSVYGSSKDGSAVHCTPPPPTAVTSSAAATGANGSHAISASSSSTSSSTASFTPPPLRKTPEPVRFNPEPWAPRGRFAQPSSHLRSHSSDLSCHYGPSSAYTSLPTYSSFSTSIGSTSSAYSLPPIPTYSFSSSSNMLASPLYARGISSRGYGSTPYYHPHASPLVSRRLVAESRAAGAAAGVAAAAVAARGPPPARSRSRQEEGSMSPPLLQQHGSISSPHYRYTQEVQYKSRPYYTPEPQRRAFSKQYQ